MAPAYPDTGHRQAPPLSCPPHIAAAVALGGLYMGVAGFSGGLVAVGAAGLLAIGLAVGFTGTLRTRLLLAGALWASATALTVSSIGLGPDAYPVIAPVLFCLGIVAVGQGAGLVAGILIRSPTDADRAGSQVTRARQRPQAWCSPRS